ncbi:MAG TPA: hypothetical protein VLM05_12865 [Mycobacteriales bacterium]|nr:hypothetical protein [Mycobacteriales bacterium]
MRLSRLPAVLVAAVLLAGIASCATTVDGTGTIASDVVTGGVTPSGDPSSSGSPEPGGSESPTAEPTSASPTADPAKTRELALCVLERAAIATVNRQFNDSKNRSGQIKILKSGVTTIKGHISRSSLPTTDPIRRSGQGVLDELSKLATSASGGSSPSTTPYNQATQKFQKACNAIS